MSSQLLSLKIPSNKPCKTDLIILKASESELHPKMNTVVHLHLCWSRKSPIHTIRNQWETLHDTQPYMALFKTTYIHDPSFPCHLYKTAPRTSSQTTLTPLPTSTYLLFPFYHSVSYNQHWSIILNVTSCSTYTSTHCISQTIPTGLLPQSSLPS
jgi:hypothetical protein